MKYVPRKIEPAIHRELASGTQVVVITGMRRVGKTRLLEHLQEKRPVNTVYFDLENIDSRTFWNTQNYDSVIPDLTKRGKTIRKKKPGEDVLPGEMAWILLDEIQLVRNIPSVMKYLSDHYTIQFIVTGSSSFYLKNLFSESLAGRKRIFRLAPLDFGEYLPLAGLEAPAFVEHLSGLPVLDTPYHRLHFRHSFAHYRTTGGFPGVAPIADPLDRQKQFSDILTSYITIDVRTLADIRGEQELEALIRLLPGRIGQKIDVSRIAREIGISRPTTSEYLRFLKDTFVIDLIEKHTTSIDRRVSGAAKLYFCDHGLGQAFSDISEGQQLENIVSMHLSKRYKTAYFQRPSGVEIDFVLDGKIGVEVKSFATPSDVRRLARIGKSLGLSETYVITGRFGQEITPGILPAYLLGFLA